MNRHRLHWRKLTDACEGSLTGNITYGYWWTLSAKYETLVDLGRYRQLLSTLRKPMWIYREREREGKRERDKLERWWSGIKIPKSTIAQQRSSLESSLTLYWLACEITFELWQIIQIFVVSLGSCTCMADNSDLCCVNSDLCCVNTDLCCTCIHIDIMYTIYLALRVLFASGFLGSGDTRW